MASTENVEKGAHAFTTSPDGLRTSSEIDQTALAPEIGEFDPEEAVTGGVGRHLGVWSTTSLMYG